MERLKQRDLATLLDFLRDGYAIRNLDAFASHVVSALPRIVHADYTSYNEINAKQGRVTVGLEPKGSIGADTLKIFERHMLTHPVIARYQRSRNGQALKISDLLSRCQFHSMPLYNEFYRRVGVEHQMAFWLPTPPPLSLGIALNRGRRDFSERDRRLLNLLRPHLTQAYRNAEAVTGMQEALTQVTEVLEGLDHGVVVLGRAGRVQMMTRRARQWLGEYFGAPAPQADLLPEALRRWVRAQERGLAQADAIGPPRQPLLVEQEGKQLRVRLLSEPGQNTLLLEERRTAIDPTTLERFGLSRREAEVLAWVAQGKTNGEIGTILGISPRTVGKHLEQIFQKVGVENRTAAALTVRSLPESEEAAPRAS